MARPKSKGALRTFIFSVDANDPKYAHLVEYLESIDNGARSYVIRQILNSYICEQNTEIFVEKNIVKKEENIKAEEKTETVSHTTTPVQTKKSSFKNKMNSGTPASKTNIPTKVEEAEEDKIVPSEGMAKLMNNFM